MLPESLYVCSDRQRPSLLLSPLVVGETLATMAALPPWDLSQLRAHISYITQDRQMLGPFGRERVWAGIMTHLLCCSLQLASKPFGIKTFPSERHRRLSLQIATWVPASAKVSFCPSISKSRSVSSYPTAWSWKTGRRSNPERNALIRASDNLDFNWALPAAPCVSIMVRSSFFK